MILAKRGVNLDHVKYTNVKLNNSFNWHYYMIFIVYGPYSMVLVVLNSNKWTKIRELKITDKNLSRKFIRWFLSSFRAILIWKRRFLNQVSQKLLPDVKNSTVELYFWLWNWFDGENSLTKLLFQRFSKRRQLSK